MIWTRYHDERDVWFTLSFLTSGGHYTCPDRIVYKDFNRNSGEKSSAVDGHLPEAQVVPFSVLMRRFWCYFSFSFSSVPRHVLHKLLFTYFIFLYTNMPMQYAAIFKGCKMIIFR